MTRIVEASDVSLTSEMNVLDSGGTATRTACGSTTRCSVGRVVHPDGRRRLPLPRGTERIAARMVSAAYPPTFSVNATTADGNGSSEARATAARRR